MRVTREKVIGYVHYWQPILGLDHWFLRVRFTERSWFAHCKAAPMYEKATLDFNLDRIRNEMYHELELEELVLHEMVHCIIWESSERAVTQIARAILRGHDKLCRNRSVMA